MNLPDMPASLISREYLRVGGGFGAAAEGASPAGGLDMDDAGNLAMDGDLHVGGALACDSVGDLNVAGDLRIAAGGCDKTWQVHLPPSMIWPDDADGPAPAALNPLSNNRLEAPSLHYAAGEAQRAYAMLSMPADYDGGHLRFTLYWTCAVAGALGDVLWSVGALFADAGDPVTGVTDSVPYHSVATPLGTVGVLRATDIHFPGTAPKATCWLSIARNGLHASDTLDAAVALLGVHVAYA